MTELARFQSACDARPGDSVTLGIFADWCAENGLHEQHIEARRRLVALAVGLGVECGECVNGRVNHQPANRYEDKSERCRKCKGGTIRPLASEEALWRGLWVQAMREAAGEGKKCPSGCFKLSNGIYCVRSPKHAGTMAKTCRTCDGTGTVSNGFAEWGEFAEVQEELAGMKCHPWCESSERADALRKRERELMLHNWAKWASSLPGQQPALDANLQNHTYAINATIQNEGCTFVFDRGLPARIRIPFDQWCGESCERCENGRDGNGNWILAPENATGEPCYVCHGTGRTPGIGPQLVRDCPIVAVELTGKEPWQEDDLYMWLVGDETTSDLGHAITEGIAGLMIGGTGHIGRDFIYPSREAAIAALNAAALSWARGQAFTPLNPSPRPQLS